MSRGKKLVIGLVSGSLALAYWGLESYRRQVEKEVQYMEATYEAQAKVRAALEGQGLEVLKIRTVGWPTGVLVVVRDPETGCKAVATVDTKIGDFEVEYVPFTCRK